MFLMPGMIIALYTCGQLDKVCGAAAAAGYMHMQHAGCNHCWQLTGGQGRRAELHVESLRASRQLCAKLWALVLPGQQLPPTTHLCAANLMIQLSIRKVNTVVVLCRCCPRPTSRRWCGTCTTTKTLTEALACTSRASQPCLALASGGHAWGVDPGEWTLGLFVDGTRQPMS